jgi:hypothetical protein
MPSKTWVVGEEVLAADFNAYVQEQVVATFPTVAARDAAITAPKPGMACYVTGAKVPCFYDGTNWIGTQSGNAMYTSNAGGGADIPYPAAFKAPPAVVIMVMTPAGGNPCWGSLHTASNATRAHVLYLNSVGGVVSLLPSYALQVSWVAIGPI